MLAAGMWLFLSLVVARLTPTVIVPLFFKYSAVQDEGLRRRILAVFDRAKVFIRDAYVINLSAKTKKANAFICGLGRGRRVVLSDTLVEQFTPGEIETVVAHELGHYCHRDIAKMIVVNTVVVVLSFAAVNQFLDAAVRLTGVNGIADIALFPMLILALTVLGLFSSPLLNVYSRMIERQADRYSLELTGRPGDFISLMTKLGQINLSEMTPSRFHEIMFYDHPPISQRIAMAAAFKPA
jgi:STE24 endopeptidase